jgi:hypothetical protein
MPVLEAETIVHDFIIENTGTAILEIRRIKTGCGCITSNYTPQLAPGATGSVSISVDTAGYGGREMKQTILLETNDPEQPQATLKLRCRVQRFAEIMPRHILLKGTSGETICARVRVTPTAAYPFRITGIKTDRPGNIRVEVEEAPDGKRGDYVLRVTNLKTEAKRYVDAIILSTDSDLRPELRIRVYGAIGRGHGDPTGTRKDTGSQ